MDAFEVIIAQLFVLWVMIAGLAYIVRGPRWASVVMMWPVRTTMRLIRRAVGGIIVAIGQWIRG